MRGIWIHKIFAPVKRLLPAGLSSSLRRVGTSLITPLYFSVHSGHFLSSMKGRAVNRSGQPIPWYSYPAIDFLSQRRYEHRTVLEFGAGHSTLFWAKRCSKVLAFESDPGWLKELSTKVPPHVDLQQVSPESPSRCVEGVRETLRERGDGKFDLIVIDGLYRQEMAELSRHWVNPTGAIIVDDAEGYGCFEAFKDSDFQRVDFFGHTPGVLLPHCTSIYFRQGCFLFDPAIPIHDVALSRTP